MARGLLLWTGGHLRPADSFIILYKYVNVHLTLCAPGARTAAASDAVPHSGSGAVTYGALSSSVLLGNSSTHYF